MNKYSKFSTTPIVPSSNVAISVPYAGVKPAPAAKTDEPSTAVPDEPKK